MDWLTQLPNFVGGLFGHWIVLLTGGIGVLLLGFWERKRRAIPFPAYIALVIATVLPAAYLSWLDEHQLRVKAEATIESFSNLATERRQYVDETLNRFYERAEALIHENIASSPNWAQRVNEFAQGAGSWIQRNMGSAALAKFQDINGPSFAYQPAEHANELNWLNKVAGNLQELRRDPAWDANAPRSP